MSNRQARIARKQAQREGTEAYFHLKPTVRVLAPVPLVTSPGLGTHPSNRETARRHFRYEQPTSGSRTIAAKAV